MTQAGLLIFPSYCVIISPPPPSLKLYDDPQKVWSSLFLVYLHTSTNSYYTSYFNSQSSGLYVCVSSSFFFQADTSIKWKTTGKITLRDINNYYQFDHVTVLCCLCQVGDKWSQCLVSSSAAIQQNSRARIQGRRQTTHSSNHSKQKELGWVPFDSPSHRSWCWRSFGRRAGTLTIEAGCSGVPLKEANR